MKYTKKMLDSMTLQDLRDLLTDIINDREGTPDGTDRANELDDLYNLVDMVIYTKTKK